MTLHHKVSLQKKLSRSGGQDTEPGGSGFVLAGGPGRVTDQPLEHGQIVEKAAAAAFRQATTGMRPVARIALGDIDEACFLQHLKMTAEIAVGQPAELLQVGESQSLGVRHQRGQKAEPGLLVNDAIETVIGKRRAVRFSLRHRFLRKQNAGGRPSVTDRPRTAGPSSMATARGFGLPGATPWSRTRNTRRRQRRPCAATIGPKRISRAPPAVATDRAASTASPERTSRASPPAGRLPRRPAETVRSPGASRRRRDPKDAAASATASRSR